MIFPNENYFLHVENLFPELTEILRVQIKNSKISKFIFTNSKRVLRFSSFKFTTLKFSTYLQVAKQVGI